MHTIQMLLGVISPEIYRRRDQTFEASVFKDVISPEINGKRDQAFEASAFKDMINPKYLWKEGSNTLTLRAWIWFVFVWMSSAIFVWLKGKWPSFVGRDDFCKLEAHGGDIHLSNKPKSRVSISCMYKEIKKVLPRQRLKIIFINLEDHIDQ